MEASRKISSARGRAKKAVDSGRERGGGGLLSTSTLGWERCEASQIAVEEGGFARWVNNKNHPHNSSGQAEGDGRRRKRERLELLISAWSARETVGAVGTRDISVAAAILRAT